jgi:hypothetical protein
MIIYIQSILFPQQKKEKFNGEVEKNESLQNLPSKVRVLLCPQGSLP